MPFGLVQQLDLFGRLIRAKDQIERRFLVQLLLVLLQPAQLHSIGPLSAAVNLAILSSIARRRRIRQVCIMSANKTIPKIAPCSLPPGARQNRASYSGEIEKDGSKSCARNSDDKRCRSYRGSGWKHE
jgi:hypothetical protein